MTDALTKPLAGKIAFVTGSGRGLGRAMADKLASLGADVAIHDLTETGPAKYGEAANLDEVAADIARTAPGSRRCSATSATRRRSPR